MPKAPIFPKALATIVVALAAGGCTSNAPPEALAWQFGDGGFVPITEQVTEPAYAPYAVTTEAAPTAPVAPVAGWFGMAPPEPTAPTTGENRWRTQVIPERAYQYRGGRDPRTGLADGTL